jgi:hypothetical protein
MTPDELRALADALEPMARAPRFEDFDVPGFCAWVRACAEAKPVAWTARHTSVTRFALWLFINNALARSERAAQKGSYEPVENVAKYQDDAKTAEEARAMLAAAPAAPQAGQPIDLDAVAMQQMRQAAAESTWMPSEYTSNDWIADVCRWLRDGPPAAAPPAEPDDPHMIVAEDRFPDVPAERWKPCPQCGEDFDRECPICDGLGRVLATDGEQAEPKREPLTYEQLVSACYTYRHDFGLLDPDEQELVIEEAGRWAKAFGIGGSDEHQ